MNSWAEKGESERQRENEEQRAILYFICTGNSCRSQMAEGWAKYLGGDRFRVYSGGLEPRGVHLMTVEVMREVGIDISGQTSDPIDATLLTQADWAITLCGDAGERCPVTPPTVKRLHWGLPDPAKVTGSPDEIKDAFRRVRDEIGRRVQELLKDVAAAAR
ncbi:MAG TPA: arsenate reductase (thioredoxin) [Alicyclobacillus sp.]|nr:arsenate reductase (thioredoxin) [Alicyclobacillus sp.]